MRDNAHNPQVRQVAPLLYNGTRTKVCQECKRPGRPDLVRVITERTFWCRCKQGKQSPSRCPQNAWAFKSRSLFHTVQDLIASYPSICSSNLVSLPGQSYPITGKSLEEGYMPRPWATKGRNGLRRLTWNSKLAHLRKKETFHLS